MGRATVEHLLRELVHWQGMEQRGGRVCAQEHVGGCAVVNWKFHWTRVIVLVTSLVVWLVLTVKVVLIHQLSLLELVTKLGVELHLLMEMAGIVGVDIWLLVDGNVGVLVVMQVGMLGRLLERRIIVHPCTVMLHVAIVHGHVTVRHGLLVTCLDVGSRHPSLMVRLGHYDGSLMIGLRHCNSSIEVGLIWETR